jgi:RNase P subunit RPR2
MKTFLKKLIVILKKLKQNYCNHSRDQGKYIKAIEVYSRNNVKYVNWTCVRCEKILATFRENL